MADHSNYITMLNFIKISQTAAEINGKSLPFAILDYQIPEILMTNWLRRAQVHHRAKFCSNSCGDIVIFLFFKMPAVYHFGFSILVILMASRLWRAQMHHHAKLCQNWLLYVAIFLSFQDGSHLPSCIYGGHFGTTHKK